MQARMKLSVNHISTLYLSAEMSLDIQRKATSANANTIYKRTTRLYSLQKERWLHYMYRVIQMNDMYSIYRFKIIHH